MIVSPARTRVLLALIAVYERDGRATVSSVAAEAGRSVVVTHSRLVELRRLGLVTWTDGTAGTLRPAVKVVR